MEKFIPYEKLSKKEKRSRDLSRRNTWGQLNPVTRKPKNSKAYCRSKARNWKRDAHEPIPGWYFIRVFRAYLKTQYSCAISTKSKWKQDGQKQERTQQAYHSV